MARIRTIKPEFPQSESMGRVSRDARLCFVQMWTLADDEGRLRGNSRMLASLLFPYDDDAPDLIDSWLAELDDEGCVIRYIADGSTYIQITNWLSHQKIDKPSSSKIPTFDGSSRILANPRESSCVDQGSRIKDQGSIVDADASTRRQRSAPDLPACPFESIVGLYHEKLPELPGIRIMDEKRRDLIRGFWRWVLTSTKSDGQRRAHDADQALTWIGQYFERARLSDLIMGQVPRNDGSKPWKGDLEYLLSNRGKKRVIEKTAEGS